MDNRKPTNDTLGSKWSSHSSTGYFSASIVHTERIRPLHLNRIKFTTPRATWDKAAWQVASQRFQVRFLAVGGIGTCMK